jgi:hypothetical protein
LLRPLQIPYHLPIALLRAAPCVVFVFHQLVFAAVARFSTGKAAIEFRAAAQRSTRTLMGKNNIPPDNRSPRDLLGDLLAAIGMADANPYQTWPLSEALQEIKSAWLARGELANVGPYRKELRRFRANTAKRRELRKQFVPVVREAIALAGWIRANPNVDESTLRALMPDRVVNIDPAEMEEEEDRDIEFVIERAGDYRKRQVRKLVVEPFLLLLEEYRVVPDSKLLPLNRMMQALFDWLGIKPTLRPTDSGIGTIARDLRKRDQRD